MMHGTMNVKKKMALRVYSAGQKLTPQYEVTDSEMGLTCFPEFYS